MEKADLVEQLIEWGGERLSQESVKYIGKKALVFEQLTGLKYYCGLLGHDLDTQKYSALVYKGKELTELEFLANNSEGDLKSRLLFVFLENLITLSSFYIFLLREDEGIKKRYEIEFVDNRSQVEELFLGKYQGKGYINVTGMDAMDAKNLLGGKGNTYHWDDTFGSDGYLLGHGAGNPDATMPHLQIHPKKGNVIRIFFGTGSVK